MIVSMQEMGLAQIPLTPDYLWPYGLALLAMILWGVLGFKAGQPWVRWAIGGAVGALVVGTIASGLATATAVPYTYRVTHRHQWIACGVVVVLVLLLGFLLSLRNHKGHLNQGADSRVPQH